MTKRTRTKYAVAVVAAALASLALVATVGLTRSEANRREPQGAPPNRPNFYDSKNRQLQTAF